jgi:mannitol/fructose-specific phosphotransferase system IIA component (Ntr-type)
MELEPYLHPEQVQILQDCKDQADLLNRLASMAGSSLPALTPEELASRLLERERLAPTGTRDGVAFPHVLAEDIEESIVIVALVPGGIPFAGTDSNRCDLIFSMFGSSTRPWVHVHMLARMARLVHTEESRRKLRAAKNSEELLDALLAEDRSHG